MSGLINIVIGIALVGWVLSRQLRTRPVKDESSAKLFLILGVIGLVETVDAFHTKSGTKPGAATIVWIIASLAVAAGFGVARAMSVKVWKNKAGKMVSKGSVITIVLWVIAIALHFIFELLINHSSKISGVGSATILLYIAISLGVQREIVRIRAAELVKD